MTDRRVIALYDEYTHGGMGRREFLRRLAGIAGGTSAAAALLPLLENNYAQAMVVAPDDPAITAGQAPYPGPDGAVQAYVAAPAGDGRHAAVVVIHENRGLNPHIEDVARRAALAGFLAIAPDALSGGGGTPADEDAARVAIAALDRQAALDLYRAAVAHAAGHARGNGRVGTVGFCWGGGMVGQLAVHEPALHAGVVFYGRPPAPEDVVRIRAPLLLHYAGRDARINEAVPAFEAALQAAGRRYEKHVYPDTDHAFHNDTNTARHDPAAAALAWERTVAFLRRELAG